MVRCRVRREIGHSLNSKRCYNIAAPKKQKKRNTPKETQRMHQANQSFLCMCFFGCSSRSGPLEILHGASAPRAVETWQLEVSSCAAGLPQWKNGVEAIASKLEDIALRLEAIPPGLEAIALSQNEWFARDFVGKPHGAHRTAV